MINNKHNPISPINWRVQTSILVIGNTNELGGCNGTVCNHVYGPISLLLRWGRTFVVLSSYLVGNKDKGIHGDMGSAYTMSGTSIVWESWEAKMMKQREATCSLSKVLCASRRYQISQVVKSMSLTHHNIKNQ